MKMEQGSQGRLRRRCPQGPDRWGGEEQTPPEVGRAQLCGVLTLRAQTAGLGSTCV